jgi:NAD(P)H-hydrate epimerase
MADGEAIALPPWPPRARDAHKGDFGRVLVVGGSPGYTGAPALAANAAQRGGAGLVTVLTPELCWPIVALHCVEPMVHPMPCSGAGAWAPEAADEVLRFAAGASVVCCGPGLGQHPDTVALVRRLVRECAAPLVLDADGLNAVAGDREALAARRGRTTVCTPHPGEMARLAGLPRDTVQRDRAGAARAFAGAHRVVVVLKGHRTVVADGGEAWVNDTGNPGMASGGTGDVLAGFLAALIGQGFGPAAAARLAVHLHGRAGDLAAAAVGEVSLVAGDLLAHLSAAIVEYQALGGRPALADEASLGGGEIR